MQEEWAWASFVLRWVYGYSEMEIASMMDLRVATVERRCRRITDCIVHGLTSSNVSGPALFGKGSIPIGRCFGSEGRFDESIGPPARIAVNKY
jgi:hypothetical protein